MSDEANQHPPPLPEESSHWERLFEVEVRSSPATELNIMTQGDLDCLRCLYALFKGPESESESESEFEWLYFKARPGKNILNGAPSNQGMEEKILLHLGRRLRVPSDDDETENYTALMTFAAEVTETPSKALKTEKSYESDDIVGSLEEESNDEDMSELQQAYNQLYKQSYKLANANVKLNKKLKEALQKVDSLKKGNEDAQAEILELIRARSIQSLNHGVDRF
ncbi:U3 small nucleolar RNA-associated protein like [Actinidia chinensis var. chinensis]|uniref:U3 small nucleolar RNA-associated protein like n=1 Tax=Actinidia chinensis var. chinensis TaxID=1590841 RepID=A0A2R6QHH4_ACTCC|nr:U3 small nucleolar RNA-associated protein like [Actinidia chinensis var. chinensis]